MKQVILSYRTGALDVLDVPAAKARPGTILVRNVHSVVSAGTEKLVTDLAQKSLLGKAMARPDQVRRVINKARTDGILEAYQQASQRLDTPVPLGYSCAGEVIAVGDEQGEFQVGDRVACAGQGHASHAELISVPKNLCVRIPAGVDYGSAAFVMLGAIALHGVRIAQPTLGDRIVVLGLGLLGQIAVQILRAAGCHVFGTDLVPQKVALAQTLGAEGGASIGHDDVAAAVTTFTQGVGADAVLIFASTTSNEPVELAGNLCRERGRIVAVGAVRLDIPRNLFYEKELSVVVSRSSGPGIYDPQYEQHGVDYPLPYVRWTQRRNMEEFLHLVAQKHVNLAPLITHRFPIEQATTAYDLLSGKLKEPYLGVLLTYPETVSTAPSPATVWLQSAQPQAAASPASAVMPKAASTFGLIGAGLFAKTTLIPTLQHIPTAVLRGVATATSSSARHIGDKFGFAYCTTDYHALLQDPEIGCIVIATRHHLHASLVAEALRAGKHVFVEKPLALNRDELHHVSAAYAEASSTGQPRVMMVGFNRRFAPLAMQAKQWLGPQQAPLVINCRVNAGFVPGESWVHDPVEGGGRILGEVCHFVDFIQYLTDSVPTRVYAEAMTGHGVYSATDNLVVSLKLADGSVATITYTAAGDRMFPRERIEIFGGGAACAIDNFKAITFTHQGSRKSKRHFLSLDRGYQGQFEALCTALQQHKPSPIAFREYLYSALGTFAITESLQQRMPIDVYCEGFEHPGLTSRAAIL